MNGGNYSSKDCGRPPFLREACGLLLSFTLGCTTPGAIAPSTHPVVNQYVELSGRDVSSSCGYTVLTIPLKNPQPVSAIIEEMILAHGGDALAEVSSNSSTTFYLLGVAHCLEIHAKVIKTTQ
jgi:hypothetical protein